LKFSNGDRSEDAGVGSSCGFV
jgi:3-hydroxyisobutyrate dehydrogenase-like beta-hydroxyacid dehydrogenase